MDEGSTLDGNAVAGLLAEVWTFEPTSARTVCAGCGAEAHLGALPAYTRAPGAVLRCIACGGVQLRIATDGKGRVWLDLTGVRCLEIPSPGAPA
jgi:hypothetical protein